MNPARARQDLRTLIEQLSPLLQPVFEPGLLVTGAVYKRRFRCGQPTCHCVDGSLHEYWSLSLWRGAKKTVRRILPGEDQRALEAATRRYRAVRRTRTAFLRWTRRIVKLMDALERSRRRSAGPKT
jgi:hypothetical protein